MALKNFSQQADTSFLYVVENLSLQEVTDKIFNYFSSKQYKLEKGTKEDAVYGIGNDVLRIIFGAFVRRYKFQLTVTEVEKNVHVVFKKAMSGVSGGAIGYSKLNKEYSKVSEELRGLLS